LVDLTHLIAHEMRTPLTRILTSILLLRDYRDRMSSDRQDAHFDQIEAEVRSITQFLDDILEMARIEASGVPIRDEIVDITDMLANLIARTAAQYSAVRVRVVGCDYPLIGRTNFHLLDRIFGNLISNAFKYTPAGGEVAVSVTGIGERLTLSIRDTGIGIPLADQARLFEPFHRANNARAIKGTGLGLYIVKRAVVLLGGQIEIESVEGRGTTFLVSLPFQREAANAKV